MKIVFVGLNGVPNGKRAADARLGAFIRMLEEEHEVTVMSASPLDAVRILRMKRVDVLHVYCAHYLQMLFYWLLSRFVGILHHSHPRPQVVYQYVEYRSAFHWDNGRKKTWLVKQYQKLNGYLCDHYGAKLWDSCIAISDFLMEKAHEVNPKLKMIKIPPVCDVNIFENNNLPRPVEEPYLFYCGNREYIEVANTIRKAYDHSQLKEKVKLIVHMDGGMDYDKLISYYKHAYALLVPLRNETAEIARFPHKVCEYCASRGVIVTTAVGEMNNYFRDGENAIVASECTVDALIQKFDAMADGKYDMEKLRQNAFATCLEYFTTDSYRSFVSQLS